MSFEPINEVDKIEIQTLQDNYIDKAAIDNSAMVARTFPLKAGQLKNPMQNVGQGGS